MDRRNCHDGQLKTRLEAFLEILKNTEVQKWLDIPVNIHL
jgi:hypothetical protein